MSGDCGSKVWLTTVRIIMFLTPVLFTILWWWVRGVTLMAIDTKQEVAIQKVELCNFKERVLDLKSSQERGFEEIKQMIRSYGR